MTRRAYFYFVITFVIGVVVGAAGVYYYGWSAGKWRHPWNENTFIQYWAKQLNLTPSQLGQVRSITDDTIKKHVAIDNEKKPQLEALRQEWRTRVRQILNPQQASKFDEINRRHRAARKKEK
jgi:Spy/CpxP family protein refolding chaperone